MVRADLVEKNPVRLEDAKCGCERYEVDTEDVNGLNKRGVVCLHDSNCKPKPLRKKVGSELKRVVRK